MKKLLLLLLLCCPLVLEAQSNQYYLYNIISFDGSVKKEGLKINVDNGKEIEKLKNADGKVLKFNTTAAALMYFTSQGWELYLGGSTSEGGMSNGMGLSESTPYWILRKPCTKEELDKAVEEGIRK